MKGIILFLFIYAAAVIACTDTKQVTQTLAVDNMEENPPCEGFNINESDTKAIEIADEVMKAMGGRKAWDETRYITWEFGSRDLLWDKLEGNVRIESSRDTSTYLVNIHTMEGKVFKNGVEVTAPEELKKGLERARAMWINDSYWLVMPFKLKDTGVTLTYQREDTTQTGIDSDVLQLTFESVGVTPQNKYEVWVDKNDRLVKQWAYYREAAQDSANSIWPFDNYSKYNEILLSADRSNGFGPKKVLVEDDVDANKFSDPMVAIRD